MNKPEKVRVENSQNKPTKEAPKLPNVKSNSNFNKNLNNSDKKPTQSKKS
jgi:hypothetical protein